MEAGHQARPPCMCTGPLWRDPAQGYRTTGSLRVLWMTKSCAHNGKASPCRRLLGRPKTETCGHHGNASSGPGPVYGEVMSGRSLRIALLGGFTVEMSGRLVPATRWRQRRAASVVKMLALAPQHRLAREQLMEALWPDLPPVAAARNLRKAAYRARRAMDVADSVVLDGGMVHLLPGGEITTDVDAFERRAREALARGDVDGCRAAASLFTGELLPDDRYAAWCGERRDQLRMTYLAVLSGGQLWGRVLEVDPADERAHREIIRGHVQAGDRRAAIRQFDRMRGVLREELGVSPDPESIALYERVLDMEGRDVPTPAERARALLAWGVVHWERSDLSEAERSALEVRALAVDAGLGRELADASELLGLVAYAQGRWREVFGREFLEMVERTPELAPFLFDANLCMSEFALEEPDGVPAMTAFAEHVLQAAGTAGSLQGRALGLLLAGEARLLGDRDGAGARTDLAAAVRLFAAVSSTAGQALATERLAQAEAACDRIDVARHLHDHALNMARASNVGNHLVLFVYGGMLETAEPGQHEEVLRAGEAASMTERVCDPCSMPFRIGASIACAGRGDLDRARGHLADAERIAEMWQGGPRHAGVIEARAMLALAEGSPVGEAAALLWQAAGEFAAAQRPRDEARCQAAAAAL